MQKTIGRRSFVALGAIAALGAKAQTWPDRPVKIIVPFAAGGPTDFIARMVAAPLSEALGQPVIIDNKPGASGNLGAMFVADAPADGYTLLHNTVAMQAVNPLMYKTPRFDPAKDLTPVGITGAMPNVLVVNPKLGIKSVAELVDRGRQKAGNLTYATFGPGTSPHIYGSVLQKLGNFKAIAVPYKGSAPAIADVMAGQVDFLFDSMTTCVGQVQAGRVVGLAITSSTRSSLLPQVPTLAESGFPTFDLKFWFSLQAPVRTPAPMLTRLRDVLQKAASDPKYVADLVARGAEPVPVPASDVPRFVQTDSKKWEEVARTLELKPE